MSLINKIILTSTDLLITFIIVILYNRIKRYIEYIFTKSNTYKEMAEADTFYIENIKDDDRNPSFYKQMEYNNSNEKNKKETNILEILIKEDVNITNHVTSNFNSKTDNNHKEESYQEKITILKEQVDDKNKIDEEQFHDGRVYVDLKNEVFRNSPFIRKKRPGSNERRHKMLKIDRNKEEDSNKKIDRKDGEDQKEVADKEVCNNKESENSGDDKTMNSEKIGKAFKDRKWVARSKVKKRLKKLEKEKWREYMRSLHNKK